MDIGKSISYVFEDRRWISKVLIGAVILLVSLPLTAILVGFLGLAIVTGYSLEVLRNVRRGDMEPLPEWQDRWSEWLVLGLKLWAALFVWSLPLLVLGLFNSLGTQFTAISDGVLELFGGLLIAGAACLTLGWSILFALITPAIYVRIAETEDVRSALHPDSLYAFTRDHFGDVIIAVLLSTGLMIVASIVGSFGVLLCFVGVVITLPAALFIANLMSMHLYAQIGLGAATRAHDAEVVPPA